MVLLFFLQSFPLAIQANVGKFSVLSLSKQKRTRLSKYCPHPSQLAKNAQSQWHGPDGWKSDRMSFVDQIKTFAGAQWQGADLGEVVCLYQGEQGTFPIDLHRSEDLVLRPDGQTYWMLDKSGARFYCSVADVNKCPIIFQKDVIKSMPAKNIYDTLKNIK